MKKEKVNLGQDRPKWCHKFNEIMEDEKYFYILVGTKEVIIDKEDIEKIYPYKVCITKAGYAVSKHRYIHRLIMDCPEHKEVDHINHNTLDNRKYNLRIVTRSENGINKKATSNTGEYGITLRKDGWYMVMIADKYRGIRKTLEDAIILRDESLKGTKQAKYNYYMQGRVMK